MKITKEVRMVKRVGGWKTNPATGRLELIQEYGEWQPDFRRDVLQERADKLNALPEESENHHSVGSRTTVEDNPIKVGMLVAYADNPHSMLGTVRGFDGSETDPYVHVLPPGYKHSAIVTDSLGLVEYIPKLARRKKANEQHTF